MSAPRMSEQTGEQDELGTVEIVYLGKTRDGKDDRWRDHNGRERVFNKLHARVPGAIYSILGEIKQDGGMSVRGTPTFTGRHAEDAAVIQLNAAELEAIIKAKRLEAGTSRTGALDAALVPLLELCKDWNLNDLYALRQYVSGRIMAVKK